MTARKCVKYKDPDSRMDYGFRWENWLDGDVIQSSSWTVPSGITEISNNHNNDTTWIWLSGGTTGQVYNLINRIVTVGGRTDDRTLTLIVKNK